MGPVFDRVLSWLSDGGLVMWPLTVSAFVVWYALVFRALSLSGRVLPRVRAEMETALGRTRAGLHGEAKRWVVDRSTAAFEERLGLLKITLRAFVVAAPLLGLLGTVTGMMETFGSLGDGALYVQGGGIAAGVSEALFTTQLGLAVALPGLLLGRLLERREQRLRDAIEALKQQLVGGAT